jgi:hypothetical protein
MKVLIAFSIPFIGAVLVCLIPFAAVYFTFSRCLDFIEFVFNYFRKNQPKPKPETSFPLDLVGKFLKSR